MERGQLTSEALTSHYLRRIAAHNDELNAVIAVNPEAMRAARQLDVERASGELRGPLHGIPILIKDNIETREMPTTAGSLALAGNLTGRDAPLVARLRAAGAVILGKTNLSEWANFRSERSSSGWSAVGGQTRNPVDPTRSPCGSSSGSAAAVAAGMAAAAVGTETSGSIVCPAAATGMVGIKPTVGLVSRTHVVPISSSQDTAGPITRTIIDGAILLDAMAGPDPADPATHLAPERFAVDHTAGLAQAGLQGRRIGVLRSAGGYHEAVDERFEAAVATLAAGGAEIVDDLALETYDGFGADSYTILLYEFKATLNDYLASLPPPFNELTLATLIEFNRDHADAEMPWFRQEVFEQAQAKGALSDEEYVQARDRAQQAARAAIDDLLEQHGLAALVAPSYGPAWKIDLVTGDHFLGGFARTPAVAGYPHITVPMGKVHGLPVGLSFTGPAFSEPQLLQLAQAYERLRQQP